MSDTYAVAHHEYDCFHGSFATREEARDDLLDPEGEKPVYTGRVVPIDMQKLLTGWSAIDSAQEFMYEHVGDVSGDWLEGVTQEQEARLSECLSTAFLAWHRDTFGEPPAFFTVEDVQEHRPAELLLEVTPPAPEGTGNFTHPVLQSICETA